ncbi:TetR/AcrR family transcriptional regulator [Saccharopolyspora mangrovi]|uniref:TetR family transcriptional regulator n=1 Tax=Saccharopolyspora mangrovi TaxID=3082379 RepID=A0ABU6AJH8_9PSEU|nr:TetR family transcriptional regulator [Saccharopolyspora sp. S2-29]MEB3371719.1 TetR family transcriptional regulator [Saccharopolyspora sp. S2-29]
MEVVEDMSGSRRFDPERRTRIIDAALELIAEEGVSGTSHRKVAARADVPLGSMTYHFASMDELLREAFSRFTYAVIAKIERRLAAARDLEEAREAVADIVHEDLFATDHDLVLTHELYALAAREPAYRELITEWMQRSQEALARHFTSETARELDALIEGLTIHRALGAGEHDRQLTLDAIRRLTSAQEEVAPRPGLA